MPSAARFGHLALTDPDAAREAVYTHGCYIGRVLSALGISVNCAPVLYLAVDGEHTVIGDRAFSDDSSLVAILGRTYCDGMLASGVLPVLKHVPGHGRATVDSHHHLPFVETSRSSLNATDFMPFRELSDVPLAMTAHVAYTDIDGSMPATFSSKLIADVIRTDIGFMGLLLSDDISMRALEAVCPEIGQRALTALRAGCDLVLHCNADLAEMRAVAAVCGPMSPAAQERWQAAENMIRATCLTTFRSPDVLAKRRDELLARA